MGWWDGAATARKQSAKAFSNSGCYAEAHITPCSLTALIDQLQMNFRQHKFTIIQILLVVGLLVFIALRSQGETMSNTSFPDMKQTIISAVDLSDVTEGSELDIKKYYRLNPDDYEGISYYMPNTGMTAQEILLVKLNDMSQSDAVMAAMAERATQRATSFDGYAPEQYEMINDRVQLAKGNYVIMIIHPDAQAAKEAFLNAY